MSRSRVRSGDWSATAPGTLRILRVLSDLTSYPFFRKGVLGSGTWVIRLTHYRKVRGTTTCRKSGGRGSQRTERPARPAW
jgi:hypothetical protein